MAGLMNEAISFGGAGGYMQSCQIDYHRSGGWADVTLTLRVPRSMSLCEVLRSAALQTEVQEKFNTGDNERLINLGED